MSDTMYKYIQMVAQMSPQSAMPNIHLVLEAAEPYGGLKILINITKGTLGQFEALQVLMDSMGPSEATSSPSLDSTSEIAQGSATNAVRANQPPQTPQPPAEKNTSGRNLVPVPKPTPPNGKPKVLGIRSRTAQAAHPQSLYDLQSIQPDGTMSPPPPSRRVGCGTSVEISGVAVDDDSLRHLFAAYDADGSGMINREEFLSAYQSFETYGVVMSKKETERLFDRYDKNKDGYLRFEEFALLMLHRFKM